MHSFVGCADFIKNGFRLLNTFLVNLIRSSLRGDYFGVCAAAAYVGYFDF